MGTARMTEEEYREYRERRERERLEAEAQVKARWGGVSAARLAEEAAGRARRVAGKKRYKGELIDDEAAEQQTLFDLLRLPLVVEACPAVRWVWHPPLGGKRPGKTAGSLKASGGTAGVPDVQWPYRRDRVADSTWTDVPYGQTWQRTCFDPGVLIRGRLRSLGERPNPLESCVGLVIEMKARGGAVDPAQEEWLDWLVSQGWECYVCWSGVDAFNVAMAYAGVEIWADENRYVQRGR